MRSGWSRRAVPLNQAISASYTGCGLVFLRCARMPSRSVAGRRGPVGFGEPAVAGLGPDEYLACLRGFAPGQGLAKFFRLEPEHFRMFCVDLALLVEHVSLVFDFPGLRAEGEESEGGRCDSEHGQCCGGDSGDLAGEVH